MKSAGDVQIENAFFEFNLRLHSYSYSDGFGTKISSGTSRIQTGAGRGT